MEPPAGAVSQFDDLAERLGKAFADAPYAIVSAYLFGSHAEGRPHRESDVDLAILLPFVGSTAQETFDLRLRLTSYLIGRLHNNQVDVVVLNDAPPTLGRQIVAAGRRVYCADPAADHAFVRDVQLRAADLAPFLRRTRRVKLAAISR